jgi:hypothetical protein
MRRFFLFLVVVLMSVATVQAAALVSHYDFSDGSGTTLHNSVSGAPDGTLSGSSLPTWSAGPGSLGALDFANPGTPVGWVDCTTGGFPNSTAGIWSGTWVYWVKTSVTGGEMVPMGAVNNKLAPDNDFGDVEMNIEPGGMTQLYTRAYGPSPTVDEFILTQTGGTSIADGNWHQVAMTYNLTTGAAGTGTGAVYIDGVAQSSTIGTNAISSADVFNPWANPMRLGTDGRGAPTNPFVGSLSDVRVYDGVLSAAEIQGLYASVAVPEPSTAVLLTAAVLGLIAYAWRKRR